MTYELHNRIVLIGAGNLASHLATALLKSACDLCQIYSRTIESARELGLKTGVAYCSEISDIYPDCDIYIFCVSDSAVSHLVKSVRISNSNAIIIHTSGSLPLSILKNKVHEFGVLYPLQTFSKRRTISFSEIPICIEASSTNALKRVRDLAVNLSLDVREISSKQRKTLHLAAVFANNFSNCMYGIAGEILKNDEISFDILRPLIQETANKILTMSPQEAQTGPARRGDDKIMLAHIEMLSDNKNFQELYSLISSVIREKYDNNTINEPNMASLWDNL